MNSRNKTKVVIVSHLLLGAVLLVGVNLNKELAIDIGMLLWGLETAMVVSIGGK
jgi:hypothetical protein